jgi:GTPase SAR1 family protein
MSKIYYREAGAGVVCFGILYLLNTLDVTKKESWDKVDFWVKELLANQPDCVLYIVGTKGPKPLILADLLDDEGRAVPLDQVHAFVAQHKSTYFETSAKTGQSVHRHFQVLM